MANWHALYWLFVGAVFGIMVVGALSIGIFLFPVAILLLVFGAIRLGGARIWMAVVGFGAAPAALLIWDVTSWPWACMSDHAIVSPVIPAGSPAGTTYRSPNYLQCVQTPIGTYTAYHVMAAIAIAIVLCGLLLGLGAFLWGRRSRSGGGLRTV